MLSKKNKQKREHYKTTYLLNICLCISDLIHEKFTTKLELKRQQIKQCIFYLTEFIRQMVLFVVKFPLFHIFEVIFIYFKIDQNHVMKS